MYSTERINNLPESILKTIPPLGDKPVRFKLLNIKKDKDGKWKIPFMSGVPARDRIIDPATRKVYDIGHVVRVNSNDEPQFETPFFQSSNAGRIEINPLRPEDIILYEYLWLSNANNSNPNRDKTKRAIYELEDAEKDAQKFLDKQSVRLSALQRVAIMNEDEVRIVAGAAGLIEPGIELNVIKQRLMVFADTKPEKFHELDGKVSGKSEYYAIVRKAIDKKIIFLDKKGPYWKYESSKGKIVSALKGGSEEDQIRHFVGWLETSEEGPTVFRILKESITD